MTFVDLVDQDARSKIRNELDRTLVVEAAAGTGKTTELVARILALVKSGKAQLSRVVAVTFTDKAAGEMKLRLRSEIERARLLSETKASERTRLDRALAELEAAHIGTIHSFCVDLLRERPIEASVDPMFELIADEASLFDEAFDRWFEQILANPPEGVRRLLRRRPKDRDASTPRELLRKAGLDLVQHRDFAAPWTRPAVERERRIDNALTELRALAPLGAMAAWPKGPLARHFQAIAFFIDELDRREAQSSGRDYDALEAKLRDPVPRTGWKTKGGRDQYYAKGMLREEVLGQRDRVKAEIEQALEACDIDLAACLREELRPLVHAYEELKGQAGKLDFLDLLVRTRDLIRGSETVRRELQQRFTHLLVDEFQDTDPLQAEILFLLAASDPKETDVGRVRPAPGKIFVVGDPKQSIYRFRRADVALYERVKARLVETGAEVVELRTNFRSRPSIQQFVNAAFAPQMQGGTQANYVPLEAAKIGDSDSTRDRRREPTREPTRDQTIGVIALPVPRPYGDYRTITKWKIDESFPDAVGAFVDYLVNGSGFCVRERGEEVPVLPRHICLLFKRLQSFGNDSARPYVRALEARRIPHVLVGGRSFHAREEVLAMHNALAAIEWPDDELSVFATLRGPFFALTDDLLLAYRSARHTLSPLVPSDDEIAQGHREVSEALAILGQLHRRRNRRPTADTLSEFLERTRAHAGIAIWPTGEQALGNVLKILDLARRFDTQAATSFRAFVDRLRLDAERGTGSEAPVIEEGTEGVRMMSIHKAKGLEFPVVIMVDPTAPAAFREPSRLLDSERGLVAFAIAGCVPYELAVSRDEILRRDREEAVRLAYVATTRARDLLVIPVVGDPLADELGWLDCLNPAVYPPVHRRREGKERAGLPPFGEDTVAFRPDNVEHGAEVSIRPGAHAPEVGEHEVVFWDPNALTLDAQPEIALRQQKILEADADENGEPDRPGVQSEKTNLNAEAKGARIYEQWRARKSELIEKGMKPTHTVMTATMIGEGNLNPAGDVVVECESTHADRTARPRGKRFGSLVHAVLSQVNLTANKGEIATVSSFCQRMIGASDEEAKAAEEAVSLALAHPILRRAQSARECRREVAVAMRDESGAIVEGIADLAFCDDAGWTVVDFKTDVDADARKTAYVAQVAVYARAIAEASGRPTKAILLSV